MEDHIHKGAGLAVLEVVINIQMRGVVVGVINKDIELPIFVFSSRYPTVNRRGHAAMANPSVHVGAMPSVIPVAPILAEEIVIIITYGKEDQSIARISRPDAAHNLRPVVPCWRLPEGHGSQFLLDWKALDDAGEFGLVGGWLHYAVSNRSVSGSPRRTDPFRLFIDNPSIPKVIRDTQRENIGSGVC